MPDDGQQPGPAPIASKASKKLQGPQRGFLHNIRGIMVIACQPAREVIGRIQMRHNRLLKACEIIFCSQQSFFLGADGRPTINTDYQAMLFLKSMQEHGHIQLTFKKSFEETGGEPRRPFYCQPHEPLSVNIWPPSRPVLQFPFT
jgi:hypothetical protein